MENRHWKQIFEAHFIGLEYKYKTGLIVGDLVSEIENRGNLKA